MRKLLEYHDGLTMKEVARLLGYSLVTIKTWARGAPSSLLPAPERLGRRVFWPRKALEDLGVPPKEIDAVIQERGAQ